MVDSLKPEELGSLQLSKKLLKKHQAFIESYQREFYIRRKISVMNEKKDLIDHWISIEEDGSKGREKYLKKKESVDSDISSLSDELQGIIPQTPNNESEGRYSFLEEQINLQKEAIDYWNTKVGELSKAKAKKERRTEGEKAKTKKTRSKKRKAKKR